MTRQTLPDGSINPAWVAVRRGCLGASTISLILKKGRGGKPSETRCSLAKKLAAERWTGVSMDNLSPENEDISRGLRNESLALSEYEAIKGVVLRPAEWIAHPTLAESGCTPDAFAPNGGLVQVKSPRPLKMVNLMLAGEIPPEYVDQMDWELAVTGRQWNDLILYNPDLPNGRHIWIRRHHRDEERIAFLEEQVAAFLEEVDVYFQALCEIQFETETA